MASDSRRTSSSSGASRTSAHPHARRSSSRSATSTPTTRASSRRLSMPQTNPRRRSSSTSAQSMPRSGRGGQIEMSSVRLGDLGATTPRRRTTAQSSSQAAQVAGPWVRRLVIALVLVALLAVGGVFLYSSSIFSIESVHVNGAAHLTDKEVSDLAAVPSGTTLLRVDTAGIAARLESNAWVEHASVTRQFPSTLNLNVTERTIAAVVAVSSGAQGTQDWAIASDGTWLMMIPDKDSAEAASISPQVYTDAASALRITDVPYGVKPEVGAKCSDESVTNALKVVSSLTTDLVGQVTAVSATDTANTLLTLDNGIQIAFGAADNARDKERVCLQLMADHEGKISYINVRIPDRPTWRALS